VRTPLAALVLAGALVVASVSGLPAGESSSRPEPSYEQTRELIRLGWFDLAERALPRLADPNEAELVKAWVAERRAGLERDLRKRLAAYGEVLKSVEELRKTLPGEPRLQKELAALEAAAGDGRLRASVELLLDPRSTPEEREPLGAAIEAQQQAVIKTLLNEVARAEAEYAKALTSYRGGNAEAVEAAKNRAFDAYWRASAKCLQEMIRFGEFWPAGQSQQKRLGRQIADFVTAWVKRQNDKYEPLGPETAGVEMFMNYALGHGLALAGEVAKAVEAFDKVIAIDPADMADQAQARAIWSRAVFYKARTLADAAEKSQKKADWKAALEAVNARLFLGQAGVDRVLVIKARILKGRCLTRLGSLESAEVEFDAALKAAE